MRALPLVPALAAVVAVVIAVAPSCPMPDPVLENDAGDAAWAERATLLVWGRRPGSARETAVLTTLVEQSDRAAVARAMTQSPEYLERWQDFLYDSLAVARTGDRADSTCWGVGLLGEDPGPDLAAHIQAGPASTSAPFGSDFTMRDVTRSALRLDDLSVLYRAALFPPLTTWFEPPNLLEAASERRWMAEAFLRTHLNRNLSCLPCHNSEFSVTDSSEPEDDRSWPLPGHVEAGIFGAGEGRDINDLAIYFRRRGVVLQFGFDDAPPEGFDFTAVDLDVCSPAPQRAGCFDCACEASVCATDPSCCTDSWDATCAELCVAADVGCTADIPEEFDGCGAILGGPGGCDGCACEQEVCEADPSCCDENWDSFCALSCRERDGRCDWYRDALLGGAHRPWGLSNLCGLFEDPADLADDITGDDGWFVDDGGPAASVHALDAHLAAGAERVRASGLLVDPDGTVDGQDAFAWMVGAAVADRVWKEAFGRRLTLSHNLPRNAEQRDRLMALTTTFVRGGFSLVDLLATVVTDPLFNQAPPASAEADTPYYLPHVLDPWTVEEDDEAVRGNSAGDGVHQLSPRVRLRAAYTALGWAPPPTYQTSGESFHERFQGGIGVYLKESEPGFDALGVQPLLLWEQVVATCRDPGKIPEGPDCTVSEEPGCPGCACRPSACQVMPSCCSDAWGPACAEFCRLNGFCAGGGSNPDDWISDLVSAVESLAEDGRATTWEQAVATVKGRIVGEPWVVDDAERTATEALLGASLADPMQGAEGAEDGLRRVCGALLTSPQFFLQGVPKIPPESAVATVVVPGTSLRDHCEDAAAAMYPDGSVDCSTGSPVLR